MPKGKERTLVILKPDALQRGLVGRIVARFEQKGLKLVGIKMSQLEDSMLNTHYSHHMGKPFFEGLKSFMLSTPCIIMIWQGLDAVETVRRLAGVTKAREAEAGSIRGDFAMSQQQNLVHASDSIVNANKEINLFFSDGEIYDWTRHIAPLLYSDDEIKNS